MNQTQKIFSIISTIIILLIVIGLIVYFRKRKKDLSGLTDLGFEKQKVEIENKNGKTAITVYMSGWFKPYQDDNNKTNWNNIIGDTKRNTGIYIIRSAKTERELYVGYSGSNLYKALYRHFQYYKDNNEDEFDFLNDDYVEPKYQKRVFYKNRNAYEVCIGFCAASNAWKLERHFIKKLNPIDCTHKYKKYFGKNKETNLTPLPEVKKLDFWDTVANQKNIEIPF